MSCTAYCSGYHRAIAAFLALFICFGAMGTFVSAEEKQPTIKVGYPLQNGLTMIDKNGEYSGYTYEYLQTVAQYTGWKYEFVQIEGDLNTQLGGLLEMLQSGEIDVLGGILYSDELAKDMDYSGYSYGLAHSTLCVLNSNKTLTETSYVGMENIRIAVMKTAKTRRALLKQYAQMSGFTVQEVEVLDDADMLLALSDGRADAMLTVDLSMPKGTHAIAKFSPRPYYFVTTKGNSEIVSALNSAMFKINENEPHLAVSLYERYFGNYNDYFFMTDEEHKYVHNAGKLKVAIRGGRAPIQYKDEKTGAIRGITVEVLDIISKKSGLQFEYYYTNSEKDFSDYIASGSADLIGGVSSDRKDIQDFDMVLTAPYISAPVSTVIKKDTPTELIGGKRLALPKGFDYRSDGAEEMQYYNTPSQCIDAVAENDADYCYVNSYTAQYYLASGSYSELMAINRQGAILRNICMGIVSPASPCLISVMTKALRSISDAEIQNIIYRNAFPTVKLTLLSLIQANPFQTVLMAAAAVLLVLLVALWFRTRAMRRSAIENERYLQLSHMMGECVLEYDYVKDVLSFSRKTNATITGEQTIEHYRANINFSPESTGNEAEERDLYLWLAEERDGEREVLLGTDNGEKRWHNVTMKIIKSDGRPIYAMGKLTDVQDERRERDILTSKAQCDSLTNLYNAASSQQFISDKLENSGANAEGAMLIMDVDNFKHINDSMGHYTGDTVLIQLSGILKKLFTAQSDIVARRGGDEFMVFLEGPISHDEIRDVCRALQTELGGVLKVQGESTTISIGVAVFSGKTDFATLYRMADTALYVGKARERNGVEIVDL